MVRMSGIKWERTVQYRPVHNIISSDFPKYQPTEWKFMEGRELINLLVSHEYQRLWVQERNDWQKKMYPENIGVNVDVVKRYVATFKNTFKPPKPAEKKPFKMKKFENIASRTETKRKDNALKKPNVIRA